MHELLCREVDDVEHFLLCCACMDKEEKQMENLMEETVDGWHVMEDKEVVVVVVVDEDCDSAGYKGRVRSCTGGDLLEVRPY